MAKRWRRRMGVMILCSMAGTTLMLALQGRIREAVPLHLCSVFSRALRRGFSLAARHAGGGSGARVSRAGRQPLADGVHGLLCADTRAHRAHRPERAGDGRTAARRPCAAGAAGLAGAGCCGVFCQPRARNGFSVSGRAASRNAAGGNLSPELRRIYCVFAGNDGAACLGHGRRGKAAFRQG